jgi:hypothetical protein
MPLKMKKIDRNMNEIVLTVEEKTYRLNNNSDKHERAKKDAGSSATSKQILAHYDKHGGNIQDENGKPIDGVSFWKEEKKRLEVKQKRIENLRWVERVTGHPVIVTFLTIIAFALVWYVFGIDLSRLT